MTSMTESRSLDPPAVSSSSALDAAVAFMQHSLAAHPARGRRSAWVRRTEALPEAAAHSARDGQPSTALPLPRASTKAFAARSDDQSRHRCARQLRDGGRLSKLARRLERAAVELLDEQLAMAAVDGGGHVAVRLRASREQRERGHPAELAVPGDRQALRGGDPDADPGEASRADADEDRVGPATVEHLVEHRHQPLGYGRGRSARRDARGTSPSLSNSAALQAAVEVSMARITCDSQLTWTEVCSQEPARGKWVNPQIRPLRRIPPRERSGGSRFSIPRFRVIAEDGQPEQAPCIAEIEAAVLDSRDRRCRRRPVRPPGGRAFRSVP